MERSKELELEILSKLNDRGKIALNEFAELFPDWNEPFLVFFNLSERGNFSRTFEARNGSYVYFYELNPAGKDRLNALEQDRTTEKHVKNRNRWLLFLTIIAGMIAAKLSWPVILSWFNKF